VGGKGVCHKNPQDFFFKLDNKMPINKNATKTMGPHSTKSSGKSLRKPSPRFLAGEHQRSLKTAVCYL